MMEEEWLASDDPKMMADLVVSKASPGQLLTASIALCRADAALMESPVDRNAIEWVARVNSGEVSFDDPKGPGDGDCYLMSGAVNRCIAVAGSIDRGKFDEVQNSFREILSFLTDDADVSRLKELATILRSVIPSHLLKNSR